MKTITSKECRSRLRHAALNGSIIAGDILRELGKRADHPDIICGTANYFSTKRIKTTMDGYAKVKIHFTCCGKDIRNKYFPDRGNPQAPWLPENRKELDPSSFASLFRNLSKYENRDIEYFCSAITLDSKASIRMHGGADGFYDAYNEGNYSPEMQYGETSLHNSCMRYEDAARNAADFYTNFVGARIIVARDSSNNVLGRALVWPKAMITCDGRETSVSVLDRIYFSHQFIANRILAFAEREGIHLCKKANDCSSPTSFVVLNPHPGLEYEKGQSIPDLKLYVNTRAGKWHKGGVPFLDTFYNICVAEGMQLVLANHETFRMVAKARSTDGTADKFQGVCARCGCVHDSSHEGLCDDCHAEIFVQTPFGTFSPGKTVKYDNRDYPSFLFRGKTPLPSFILHNRINNLCQ